MGWWADMRRVRVKSVPGSDPRIAPVAPVVVRLSSHLESMSRWRSRENAACV